MSGSQVIKYLVIHIYGTTVFCAVPQVMIFLFVPVSGPRNFSSVSLGGFPCAGVARGLPVSDP